MELSITKNLEKGKVSNQVGKDRGVIHENVANLYMRGKQTLN